MKARSIKTANVRNLGKLMRDVWSIISDENRLPLADEVDEISDKYEVDKDEVLQLFSAFEEWGRPLDFGDYYGM